MTFTVFPNYKSFVMTMYAYTVFTILNHHMKQNSGMDLLYLSPFFKVGKNLSAYISHPSSIKTYFTTNILSLKSFQGMMSAIVLGK